MSSLRPVSLFDADGSAIVIHANEDDQVTNPTGISGVHVACASSSPIDVEDSAMKRLVGLYPADWQARYGPEFEAILQARPPGARDRVDIVRGAIDARLHPQVPGTGDLSPAPHPVSVLPGVLLAMGGLSWAIASAIVATARISASGYLDAGAALAFMIAAIILIPLGSSIALGDLPSAVARRGGALNGAFLVSVLAIWILPWPTLGIAMFVVFFALSGLHHAIVAARVGWVPRAVTALVVVATTGGVAGFVGVLMLGLGGQGGTASAQETFRLLYTVVVAPFGVAWALVGAFMVRRSRRAPSAAEAGGPER